MEPAYKKFNELIQKHKKNIELKLIENKFDMSSLIGMREKTPMKLKPLVNPKIHLK